ncbi:uncharacterized protein LOC134191838 isoform X1 [Corticium candelabrum]|uniref:uncharacterized protein LOC134191838 isoform X1 n=2 Tax=Corticium candelabrum TaxID=121492 RepID=UPI002E25DFC8|nr:uncharacterized protein LOC134191838 isoform X1 [Corticium candelabrum]
MTGSRARDTVTTNACVGTNLFVRSMERLEEDLRNPVAPGTRCRADERLFWYHARHMDSGRSGLVPITHVALPTKVKRLKPGMNGFELESTCDEHDDEDNNGDDDYETISDLRKPRLEPCYKTYETFKRLSGWFTARSTRGGGTEPTEAMLPRSLAEKCGLSMESFINDGPAIYTFEHRRTRGKKYVGYAQRFCTELQQMFLQLYGKKFDQLNGLEYELLFHSPVASDWVVSVDLLLRHEEADMQWMAQRRIIEWNCLRGERTLGLNESLKFTSRGDWDKFIAWFGDKWRLKSEAQKKLPPPRPTPTRPYPT